MQAIFGRKECRSFPVGRFDPPEECMFPPKEVLKAIDQIGLRAIRHHRKTAFLELARRAAAIARDGVAIVALLAVLKEAVAAHVEYDSGRDALVCVADQLAGVVIQAPAVAALDAWTVEAGTRRCGEHSAQADDQDGL